MNSVVILVYGLSTQKYRVKFVENADLLELDYDGNLLDPLTRSFKIRTEFKKNYIKCKDSVHALLTATKLVEDHGNLVTNGILEIVFKEDI